MSSEVDFRSYVGRRPRVAIGHPMLGRGGSEARVMWLIEALKRDCDLTVITTGGWNRTELNQHYDTNVQESDVSVRVAPVPRVFSRTQAAALRGAAYQRFARSVAAEYDIRLSAYNVTDWGLPAIHFIADFCWHPEIRNAYDPPTPGFIYRNTPLRRTYLAFSNRYSDPSGRECFSSDRIIANSLWTAEQLRRLYPNARISVLYPPVSAQFPKVPWEQKQNRFVMIGRVAPEKRIEAAIAVIAAVRLRGHDLKLHLCGELTNDAYGKRITRICRSNSDWIVVEGRVTGACKAQILAESKFGISMRTAEPFGISVAEMLKAGAVVFAPNCGGQAEIIDKPELLFLSESEAVEKIDSLLKSRDRQTTLRQTLQRSIGNFTVEAFSKGVRSELACAFETQKVSDFRVERESAPVCVSINPRRPRVVIGHPALGRGGSESIVMWLIQGLKDDHDVTVLTTAGWNLDELNKFYGTSVEPDEVTVRLAKVPVLSDLVSAAAFRGAYFQRYAARVAHEYDIRISAYNPTDWGAPAIHFVADFSWHPEIRSTYDPVTPGLVYRNSPVRWLYLSLCKIYGKRSGRDILRDDVVIANSHWTADLLRKRCNLETNVVVYAPVWSDFPVLSWAQKEQAFVMIGRIAPEKRIEVAIQILQGVRQQGHNLKLHLCGEIGNDNYGRFVRALCQTHASWIISHGRVTGEAKSRILASCRFGIQARSAEPFGISVAEMVKAGAIVFTPTGGGQTEITDHPALSFASVEDAICKISEVLRSSQKQQVLADHLRTRSLIFGSRAFVAESRRLIGFSNAAA